jgi:ribose transport system permease protein
MTSRQVLPWAFGLCGMLLGLAGLLQAARYGQVQTNVGTGFELKAIAAAVIGGTHIMGGRGSALGIFLGALLMGLLANILVLMHISAFWEGVFVGLVILLTVVVDTYLSRRRLE